VFDLNGVCGRPVILPLAQGANPGPRLARRQLMIEQAFRIGLPQTHASLGQCLRVRAPGFVQQRRGQAGQFRHVLADKHPVRILIMPLFDRIIDARGVHPGGARLHLKLRIMDAGFEIHELSRQRLGRTPPVLP